MKKVKYDKYKKSGIYKITNIINGNIYIGSAQYLKARKTQHFQILKRNKHHSIHLQNAYNKYGKDAFVFEILEEHPIENLFSREQHYIDTLNPEYNILKTAGGLRGNYYKNNKERCYKIALKRRKLSNEQLNEIFKLVNEGKLLKDIAKQYNYNPANLSKILSGHNYKYLNIEQKKINKNINPNKLKDKNLVLEIYNRLQNKENQYLLAAEYKVDQSSISRIKNKKRNFSWLKNITSE